MNLKKLISLGVIGLFLVGCGTNEVEEDKEKEKEPVVQANCEVKDCIKKIEVTNTVEEINDIIGFEAKKSEYSEEYTWKLDDKNSITLKLSTPDSRILQATIDKNTIKSDDVDLSVYSDIKKLLDKGKSLSYKEMVEKLGGVEGVLAGKTSTSERYIWVDKNNQTFSATFSDNNDGKCNIISLK